MSLCYFSLWLTETLTPRNPVSLDYSFFHPWKLICLWLKTLCPSASNVHCFHSSTPETFPLWLPGFVVSIQKNCLFLLSKCSFLALYVSPLGLLLPKSPSQVAFFPLTCNIPQSMKMSCMSSYFTSSKLVSSPVNGILSDHPSHYLLQEHPTHYLNFRFLIIYSSQYYCHSSWRMLISIKIIFPRSWNVSYRITLPPIILYHLYSGHSLL